MHRALAASVPEQPEDAQGSMDWFAHPPMEWIFAEREVKRQRNLPEGLINPLLPSARGEETGAVVVER